MSVLQSIVLAIVEGLTEFLPVSSTGHMIIASSLMGIATDPFTKTYIIAIQLGAILSVLILYGKKFLPVDGNWSSLLSFYVKLLMAFIPAVVLGLLLNDYIDLLLERVEVVAIFLILGGVVFLFIDNLFHTNTGTTEGLSRMSALKIGLFQTLAMAPGVSRSAATIIGGLTQKLTRQSAAEFSFFLALPTMVAATAYKLLKFYKAGNGFSPQEVQLLAIGNVVAFVVAIFAIRSFIGYLTRHGFRIFGYYRIIAGLTILLLYYFGVKLSVVLMEPVQDRVLLVSKPIEWTSFDVVNKLRYRLKIKKIGHAGTLDPLATGLLIICTGKMTKKISEFQEQEKEYTGKFVIGHTTASSDLETKPEHPVDIGTVTEEVIRQVASAFTGRIDQTPPIHSAIKVDGKRAYELARQGKAVELKSRVVEIKQFEITKIDKPYVSFKVVCSKGTYIRSLARDFGDKLGVGAYLGELCRTRIGNFKLEDASTIDEVEV